MPKQGLSRVVSERAAANPDAVAIDHAGVTVTFGQLERTAAGLRAAVPTFAAAPDSALSAALAVLAPAALAEFGSTLGVVLRAAAGGGTLAEEIRRVARDHPHRPAVIDGDRTLTFAALDAAAEARRSEGSVTPVAVPRTESIDTAVTVVALAYDGAAAVFGSRDHDVSAVRAPSMAVVVPDESGWSAFDDAAVIEGSRALWSAVASAPDGSALPVGSVLWGHLDDARWGPLEFWAALLAGWTLRVRDRTTDAITQCRRDGVALMTATVHEAALASAADAERPVGDSIVVAVDDEFAGTIDGASIRPCRMLPGVFGPFDPANAIVVDRRLRRAPAGVSGDLYVTGGAVASDVGGSAAVSAARFVASPAAAGGARALWTGVAATVDRSGAVTVGAQRRTAALRRGVRVDSADIAARLRQRPLVVDAVVRSVHDERAGVRVVAHVHFAEEVADPHGYAAEALPDYAVPDAVVPVPELPLDRSGRVEESLLPAPSPPESVSDDATAPRSPSLDVIVSVFVDVLGTAPIGRDQSFFDLGGSSLSATKAIARINAATDAGLRVADIFDAPTPRGLARVLDGRSGVRESDLPRFAAVAATASPDRIAVAPAQLRLWVLNRLDPESSAYNVPMVLHLSGTLDHGALSAALGDVIARHEILRTYFPDDGDGPVLVTADPTATELPVITVDDGGDVDAIADLVSAPFDVTAAPPVRAALVRRAETDHVLVVCVHHLVMDGESLSPLVIDLGTAFAARVRGVAPTWAEPAPQYADYARWQHAMLGTEDEPTDLARTQLAYWSDALSGLPDAVELPVDRTRSPVRPDTGAGQVRRDLPAEVHRSIDELARAHGVSEHMVLLAAYSVAVARWTGSTDFAVGIATAGRTDPALDTALGTFVGTVAVRAVLGASDTFVDVLQGIRRTAVAAYDNADVPFDRVIAAAGRAASPPYRIGFAYRASRSEVSVELPGVTARILGTEAIAAKDDLLLTAEASVDADGRPAGIALSLVYATALFDETTVDAFASLLRTTVDAVLGDTANPVIDLDVTGVVERTRVLGALRGPATAWDGPSTLPEILAAAARSHPDRPAVRTDEHTVTYRELSRRSNRLARRLIERGAGPETVVALSFPRSMDMILAVWAVAATGAAYVPLDASYPEARLAHMVSDSGVGLGVTRRSAVSTLPASVDWLDVDDVWSADLEASECDPVSVTPSAVRIDNAAYVIYTSGSTGLPKGVVVTHSGLTTLAAATRERFATTSRSRPAQTASPSFDPYVMDLLVAAIPGAELVVVPPDLVGGDAMTDHLAEQGVTHLSSTPGVVSTLDAERLPDLEMISVGGEPLAPSLRDTWAERVRLVNAYGPTEATVASHFSEPARVGHPVGIGRSLAGTGCAVLDARMHPVPDGAIGELYLFGPGLARGYRSSTSLTASRFVASPFTAAGERMYRTGDLVRTVISADGTASDLRYVGRVDAQLKIRGIRVEPGEVDAVLVQRPSIVAAITVGRPGPSGETALVSYFVCGGGSEDPIALRASLVEELPPQLVPAVLMELERLPLSPNGKVDRGALPTPEFAVRGRSRDPRTDTERAVLATFVEILGDESLGVEDDFFAGGGNSLNATRVVSRIGRDLGRRVGVRALFDAPTAEQLAAFLDASGEDRSIALADVVRPERVPLSYAQTRMWFANVFDNSSSLDEAGARWNATAYNVPLVVRITGALDVEALAAAVVDVIDRHESLRTRFPDSASGPYQEIVPTSSVPIELSPVPIDEGDVVDAVTELVTTRFDVTAAPPIAMRLWAVGRPEAEATHVFALVVHHVCTDGESMRPLVRDLVAAYSARAAGAAPAFAPLPVQYADFTVWQRARLGDATDPTSEAARHLDHWRASLAGIPDAPVLPTDRPRPPVASLRSATVPVTLDAEVHRALRGVADATGATPFMVVHSALAVFLARWGSSADVVIGTPIAGRGDRELDDLVGMFVGTLALRTPIESGASFLDTVRAVRAADLDAFSHSEIPFERVVDALSPVRSTAHHPIFQTMLSFQNLEMPAAEVAGVRLEALNVDPGTSQYDLHLVVSETVGADGSPAGLAAALTFATDLFGPDTGAAMARSFETLTAALLADPDGPVGDAALLGPAELDDLLVPGIATAPDEVTLAGLLHRSYVDFADRVAVTDTDRTLTYEELGRAVVARRDALRAQGVGPESVIAVEMSRSIDMIVEIQAIVCAGAAYLPIDPALPADRRSAVRSAARLPGSGGALGPQNPAYVVFTSGSTGAPKGVVVSHGAVTNQLRWLRAAIDLDADDAMLWRTSASFDLSVWELWLPMTAGARLVVGPPGCERDPAILARTLAEQRVSVLTFVPSLLDAFLAHGAAAVRDALEGVHTVLCIGEALSPSTVRTLVSLGPDCLAVHNLYGPTEAAVSITHHRIGSPV